MRAELASPLPFEVKTESQRALRADLRNRIAHLSCAEDEVLHASFFGPKPAGADVENLLLYNVDSNGGTFSVGAAGLRFEYSPTPMPNARHPHTYLYRPMPKDKGFVLWGLGQRLALWRAVQLRGATIDRLGLWLDLRRALAGQAYRRPWDGDFAVSVVLHPATAGQQPAVARSVKPILDATVAALQHDSGNPRATEIAAKVARAIGAPVDEVGRLLQDESPAALGRVPHLMALRADGIQLRPSDERCVAAEILIGPSAPEGQAFLEVDVRMVEGRRTMSGR